MVYLRSILADDQERMLDILTSDTVKQTYMLPDFPDRDAALPLFRRLMEMCNDRTKYVRAIAVDDCLVGFLNHTEITVDSIELGYVIHPDSQNRGYMTQALKLAMEELFSLGYRQIITGAFSTNAASIRVMEKCGMERMEKTDAIEYRGINHTCVYYSVRTIAYNCCFCGKTAMPRDAYTLSVRRSHDPDGPEQEIYCHRVCLERNLADPKLLYLKYM